MVQIRENTHRASIRHAVTTLILCAALPAIVVKRHVMVMVAGNRKEAAP